jgi:hypothetical protein
MSINYVDSTLNRFLREKILGTGPVAEAVSDKEFVKSIVFSKNIVMRLDYSDLEIGGVISQTEADIELVNIIRSNSCAESDAVVICHDPYAERGDLAYIGHLPGHVVESSSGNYYIVTLNDFTNEFIGDFRDMCVSYNKIIYLVQGTGSVSKFRESLASDIFGGFVQAVFVNCFDDESWFGSYPNATTSTYGDN